MFFYFFIFLNQESIEDISWQCGLLLALCEAALFKLRDIQLDFIRFSLSLEVSFLFNKIAVTFSSPLHCTRIYSKSTFDYI